MATYATAQTFELGNQQSQPSPPAGAKGKASSRSAPSRSAEAQEGTGAAGWGSSIEVGRMARAAEDALKHGDTNAAAGYAKRAVEAAPQNTQLWFLYGYTARLAGRENEALDAYKHGLEKEPNSPAGLAGLAQTYQKLGQIDEARRLIVQAVNADPKLTNNLLIAGEMFIQNNELWRGVEYLSRAEAQQPSSHSELLMAIAYMKLKQPARAKEMLDLARRRDPRNTEIFRAIAIFQRDQKDYDGAIATLRSAPGKNPEVLADLGYTYELAGKKKEAAATYSRLADLQPGNIGYQLSAAQAELNVPDLDRSRQFVSRAERIDAGHYRLHAIKGAIAKSENRPQDAVREYQIALSRIPEAVPEGALYPIQLRLNLAESLKNVGDEAGANAQMAIAQQAISKINVEGPAKAEFLRVRASIREGNNDNDGAEADLKQALQLDPENSNIQLQYASLLWREKRKDESRKLYEAVLQADPKNRYALESLGYLARDDNNPQLAEEFFNRLAADYPDDFVAYLALGDMFTALGKFDLAEENYEKAYRNEPQNSSVVANGSNAAIEKGDFKLAKTWVDRASGSMNDDPRVMRERERVLFHSGDYAASARLGYKVLAQLPSDRNASVYLAYDLYNLGRYDDVLALASKYENILPKEPNFPLLEGHVHKQSQLLDEAVDDYTRAHDRDPNMAEVLINRGYVENDLQNASAATQDFDAALKLQPQNGVAHLGLAFSELELRHPQPALAHVETAERLLGSSGATHLVRATAYRQERRLGPAEQEYREAIKFSPEDVGLHLALADTLYREHHYPQAVGEYQASLAFQPDDPLIYADMAHAHAEMRQRDETLRDVEEAEREGGDQSAVLLQIGDALLVLGDRNAAMERFSRALDAPDANRVPIRLALAQLFEREGKFEDARQQVSLGFSEARIGEAAPVTGDDLVEAANIFLAMHDFDLADKLFDRAKEAGASEEAVAIGKANTYLAQGDSRNAQVALASLGNPADYQDDYDYVLAQANLYQQKREPQHALTAFARANSLSYNDDIALHQMHLVASDQGLYITPNVSLLSEVSFEPLFDDATIYTIDSHLFSLNGVTPSPRVQRETRLLQEVRYNSDRLPPIFAFFQERNARGLYSLPNQPAIVNRNTYDSSFNAGVSPSVSFGNTRVTFNGGLQFTVRRDTNNGFNLNQNLFRQYLYLGTSSFLNWVAVNGDAYHESGPFTNQNLSSGEKGARLELVVGRPWGNTSMLTGYTARDLQFSPLVREFFTSSSYAGLQRKFGHNLTLAVLGEYIRSWRVQDHSYALGQALAPGVRFEYRPTERWTLDGNFTLQRGEGSHLYDNVQSGFFISYLKPLRQMGKDGFGEVPVEYPIRFSVGVQEQTFTSFTGQGSGSKIVPVVQISLF